VSFLTFVVRVRVKYEIFGLYKSGFCGFILEKEELVQSICILAFALQREREFLHKKIYEVVLHESIKKRSSLLGKKVGR
jgi:hypothetical protein